MQTQFNQVASCNLPSASWESQPGTNHCHRLRLKLSRLLVCLIVSLKSTYAC